MANLSLNGIVDVSVSLSPNVTYLRGFNTALILGPYSEASGLGTATAVKSYSGLTELVSDFGATTSVYKAAALYFGQKYVPQKVYVGCISTNSETLTEAITRCRSTESEWYVAIPTDSVMLTQNSTTLVAASTFIESADPESMIAYSLTDDETYLAILQALKSGNFSRTISQYDDVDANVANANKTCISAIIGYAMGRNNSLTETYTLAYKSVAGLLPINSFSSSQLNNVLNANGNVYITQGYYYNLFRQGIMASGDKFDEIIYLDMLVNNLKSGLMDVLVTNPKIPQTEQGVASLEGVITDVLEKFRTVGFIAPGVWNGQTVLAVEDGYVLTTGYLVQFESISSQTAEQRAARIAPACYICIKLAGAIEHIVISLVANK